jgi:transposase InsO family protein
MLAGWRESAAREQPAGTGRFQRPVCNELWQADFKALGVNPPGFRVLSVIDDCSRFVVALCVVPRATNLEVFAAFWNIFGERGMPDSLLTDNEACFHTRGSMGPSYLEARLWRLEISTLHGRPRHPQTQGKVERFHRSMEQDLGSLLKERDPVRMQKTLDAYKEDFNWARPHEACANRFPGAVYTAPSRRRPERLPDVVHPEGAQLRRVDDNGRFKREGSLYQIGRGLAKEQVALLPTPEGIVVVYAGKEFALLQDLKV